MGKCLTIVKLVGIGSLGLTTTSFLTSSFSFIPCILKKSTDLLDIKKKITKLLINVRLSFWGLGGLASYLFYQAYVKSPPAGQHPYLLYAALTAPIALIYNYYNVFALESKILNDGETQTTIKKEKKLISKTKPVEEEQSPLDNSAYNDLGAPVEPQVEQIEIEVDVPVVEKIELTEVEYKNGLKLIQKQYLYSGAIVGVGFLMSVIGYIGDNMK